MSWSDTSNQLILCSMLRLEAIFAAHKCFHSCHALVDETSFVATIGRTDWWCCGGFFIFKTVGRGRGGGVLRHFRFCSRGFWLSRRRFENEWRHWFCPVCELVDPSPATRRSSFGFETSSPLEHESHLWYKSSFSVGQDRSNKCYIYIPFFLNFVCCLKLNITNVLWWAFIQDKLAYVQVILNCRYSIAQMCTPEKCLAAKWTCFLMRHESKWAHNINIKIITAWTST